MTTSKYCRLLPTFFLSLFLLLVGCDSESSNLVEPDLSDALPQVPDASLQKKGNPASITLLEPGFVAETFASGLADPAGLTFRNPAILFVNESGFTTSRGIPDDRLSRILPNGKIKTFLSGLNTPIGLASKQGSGLFLGEFDSGDILQISLDGSSTTFASGFIRPVDMTIDASENLYVSDVGSGAAAERVARIDPDGTVTDIVTYSDAVNINPNGIAFNENGDLFIAELVPGEITKIPSTSFPIDATSLSPFAVVSRPVGLAFDENGDLFVAGQNDIFRITPTGTVTTFATGLAGGFNRITFNKRGDMYVTDMFAGTVIKISKQ